MGKENHRIQPRPPFKFLFEEGGGGPKPIPFLFPLPKKQTTIKHNDPNCSTRDVIIDEKRFCCGKGEYRSEGLDAHLSCSPGLQKENKKTKAQSQTNSRLMTRQKIEDRPGTSTSRLVLLTLIVGKRPTNQPIKIESFLNQLCVPFQSSYKP